jgi:hypothetical protein
MGSLTLPPSGPVYADAQIFRHASAYLPARPRRSSGC